jgi:sigma-B regulation protein RsbU (phosphoserine phosphatase)
MDKASGSHQLVDDEQMNRAMLALHLARQGFKITAAEGGTEALQWIDEHPFDLVLLDVVMPGLSGLDVLGRIRQHHSMTDLPIIMATAKDQSADIVEALRLGANDYVTKPFDYPVVLARVKTQLALKRSVDQIHRLERSLEQRNLELEAANRRMKRDLQAAMKIQEALLPEKLPDHPGAHFAWRFKPCTELAGDLLNVLPLDDKHVSLYVLDVVGHGVAAALLSVTVSWVLSRLPSASVVLEKAGCDSLASGVTSPATVAAQLNRNFPWDPRTEQYFTLLYGILNLDTGMFHFTSAGHPGPVYLAHDEEPRILDVQGPPIGLGADSFEEYAVALQPGDRLYLYSDGVPDAMNEANKRFTKKELLRVPKARSNEW